MELPAHLNPLQEKLGGVGVTNYLQFFLTRAMYNYFFSQIGPYTSYKYLDSQTSEKPKSLLLLRNGH